MAKKVRESNFELLRIIATLAIVIYHINGGYIRSIGGLDDWYIGGTGMAVLRTSIQSFTHVAVDVFVLISGYFSIRPKSRSVLNLATMLFFFYIVSVVCNKIYSNTPLISSPAQTIKEILPFSRENWFIQAYLFLMLLAPMINTFIENISQLTFRNYLLLFIACAFYFGCVHNSTFFYFNQGLSVTTLVLVYMVGRYMRLYGMKKLQTVPTYKVVLAWISCVVFMTLVELFLPNRTIFICNCSPIKILCATCILVLFSRFKFQSKFTNWISASCLGVFLFHVLPPFTEILSQYGVKLLMSNNPYLYLCGIIGICIICFIIGIMLDKLRTGLFHPVMLLHDRYFTKYSIQEK